MVRACRIARRWANAAIALANQVFVVECFISRVAPVIGSDLSSRICEGLSESIHQGLEHDRLVIVVVGLELGELRIGADTGRHGECPQPVGRTAVLVRNEIRQAKIGAFIGLDGLLPEEVQRRRPGAPLRPVKRATSSRSMRAAGRIPARALPPLVDHPVQHRSGIRVYASRAFTHDFIIEDRWELAGQLPRREEGVQSM